MVVPVIGIIASKASDQPRECVAIPTSKYEDDTPLKGPLPRSTLPIRQSVELRYRRVGLKHDAQDCGSMPDRPFVERVQLKRAVNVAECLVKSEKTAKRPGTPLVNPRQLTTLRY